MSHFSVMVFGEDVGGQLEPYQEHGSDGVKDEYLEFEDHTEEFRKEYATATWTKVRMLDGRLLNTWDNEFRVPGTGHGSGTHEVPDDLEKIEVPMTTIYSAFADFCRDYHSAKADGDRFGFWVNPNAKWDWWVTGGRFSRRLLLRPGAKGPTQIGRPGTMGTTSGLDGVDQAQKRDIDVEAYTDRKVADGLRRFDRWMAWVERAGEPPKAWREVLEETRANGGTTEDARPAYREQPAIRLMNSEDREFGWECPVATYGFDRDAYAERVRLTAFVPWAYVHEGRWHEGTEMGWWASHADFDEQAYARSFWDRWQSLPEDTLVTIVDCHI